MRKKRVIIYGCGFFFESHKYEVENEYNIVATVDKNNLNSKYKDIKNVDEEYDYFLIMLEKINILFEVLNEIINVKEVDNKKIIFGIEKYGFLKDTAKIQIEDNGLIIFYTENKRIIVSDEQSFYDY